MPKETFCLDGFILPIFRTGMARLTSSAQHVRAGPRCPTSLLGYAGDKLSCAVLNMEPSPTLEIVRRPNNATGFALIARRWVIERTFAWLGRCTRLAKDRENTLSSAHAWRTIVAIEDKQGSSQKNKIKCLILSQTLTNRLLVWLI